MFLLLLKQKYLKPIADFLVSHEQFSESKHQHVSHKATSKQHALASLYSKGQAARIIFCSRRSDGEEQSSNMQEQKQHSSCPERNQELVSQTPLPFKGPRK
jgi:hypothetical protein